MKENPDYESDLGYKKAPIFLKAKSIMKLAVAIAGLADKSPVKNQKPTLQQVFARYLIEDASRIAPSISFGWGTAPYDMKMESATIVRKAANDLLCHMNGLEMNGFKELEYCDVLRAEIEGFRFLFIEWVNTFDPLDYLVDQWGLFNPPGVNYDDPDTAPLIDPLEALRNRFENEDWEDEDWEDEDDQDDEEE